MFCVRCSVCSLPVCVSVTYAKSSSRCCCCCCYYYYCCCWCCCLRCHSCLFGEICDSIVVAVTFLATQCGYPISLWSLIKYHSQSLHTRVFALYLCVRVCVCVWMSIEFNLRGLCACWLAGWLTDCMGMWCALGCAAWSKQNSLEFNQCTITASLLPRKNDLFQKFDLFLRSSLSLSQKYDIMWAGNRYLIWKFNHIF